VLPNSFWPKNPLLIICSCRNLHLWDLLKFWKHKDENAVCYSTGLFVKMLFFLTSLWI
jgi:hypothetical protein